MKRITLTQGQFAIVDDEDFERLTRHKWYALWDTGTRSYYAVRDERGVDGKIRKIRMHREIMGARR